MGAAVVADIVEETGIRNIKVEGMGELWGGLILLLLLFNPFFFGSQNLIISVTAGTYDSNA